MGMSWDHTVTVITTKKEQEWADSLDRHDCAAGYGIDCPIWVEEVTDNTVRFSTGGYNILNLNTLTYPESAYAVVHRIEPCQGQPIDIVDSALIQELYEVEYDDDFEPTNYNDDHPPYEGCDLNSDYIEENEFLNILANNDGPDYNDEDEDYGCDAYDEWQDNINKQQQQDYDNLVKIHIAQATNSPLPKVKFHSDDRVPMV